MKTETEMCPSLQVYARMVNLSRVGARSPTSDASSASNWMPSKPVVGHCAEVVGPRIDLIEDSADEDDRGAVKARETHN